jgi:hypothetical protein
MNEPTHERPEDLPESRPLPAGSLDELPVIVEVSSTADEAVFRARIAMWVSPRRKQP